MVAPGLMVPPASSVRLTVVVEMSALAWLCQSRPPTTAASATTTARASENLPWRDFGAASVISASLHYLLLKKLRLIGSRIQLRKIQSGVPGGQPPYMQQDSFP